MSLLAISGSIVQYCCPQGVHELVDIVGHLKAESESKNESNI
jgi:hypothetical protein